MHYERVADLPVSVETVEFDRRERETSSGFTRATTVVSLSGDGATGRGEDVTYAVEEHDPERWNRLALSLSGEYTLDALSERLGERDLFPEPPERSDFEHYRRWAFESAALDLGLRQAGTTLGERLGREPEPVRFVVSSRLSGVDSDEMPTADRIHRWLEIDARTEFKLDPTPEWPPEVIADLADTGAVRTLDLKGQYEGTEVENPADPELYRRLVEAFPEAVIEDPALTDDTEAVLAGEKERISWDQPITGIESVEALPFEPAWLNIKPSRFGSVESLLDTIDYCREHSVWTYGGGQFELGVGRRQIQLLAALFYPDAPNDVAPRGYNDPEPRSGLPSSPLAPPTVEAGF